jgi:biopolymer transport protein ExbD
MFRSVRSREQATEARVELAPLVDIMFNLLVFFLVSATFVRETGVAVTRPQAVVTQSLEPTSMRVSVTSAGEIYTEGTRVSVDELRSKVSAFVAREKKRSVVVVPDVDVSAGRLIEVMDAARTAGATDVALAAIRKEPGR